MQHIQDVSETHNVHCHNRYLHKSKAKEDSKKHKARIKMLLTLQPRIITWMLLFIFAVTSTFAFSATSRGSSILFLSSHGSNDDTPIPSTLIPTTDMITPARQSLPDHLRLEAIPGKGFGVITKVKLPGGTVIGDYKGEIMSEEEKDRRYLDSFAHLRRPVDEQWRQSRIERGQTITGTYLYGVDIPNKSSQIFVDGEDEYHSLWTRFLNHASPPAANVNPKSLHAGMDGQPRVWFVSIRDIEIGEEICFDYGDDYWLPEDNVV